MSHVQTLRRQAELARRGGIYGFCIHNYWFSGHPLLEAPLKLLLANPDINIRFCLNWANESWSRRWDGAEKDILIQQRYNPGDEVGYAQSILPALRDPRYIRIGGRPLLMLYRPGVLPDSARWIGRLRTAVVQTGAGDPYIVMAQAHEDFDPRPYGLDAAAGFPPHNGGWGLEDDRETVKLLDPAFEGKVCSFEALTQRTMQNRPDDFRLFPGVCPRWDNEARRPGRGLSFYGSTPAAYGAWLRQAALRALEAPGEERLVFINAWNEWAEGAYLEPDRHFGYAYLAETRRILESLASDVQPTRPEIPSRITSPLMHPHLSANRRVTNKLRRRLRQLRSRVSPVK